MEFNTIISYHTFSRRLPMFCLAAGLLALPVAVHAQDEEDAEPVKKTVVVRKHYTTRHITGRVISAVSHKPLSGAIVGAVGVEGYNCPDRRQRRFCARRAGLRLVHLRNLPFS